MIPPAGATCHDGSVTAWLTSALVGQRVLLRPPQSGDETALIEMSTDPDVRAYVGGAIGRDVAAAKAAQKVNTPAWGLYVIVDLSTGDVVGSGDLSRRRGPWEVSYQLRRMFWGSGLAGEAVELIRDWFFQHTDEAVLTAFTQSANIRSRRLLERIGAVHVGSFELYGLPQERFEFRRATHIGG